MTDSMITSVDTSVRPFRIEIPEQEIEDLRLRIGLTRWPTKELVAAYRAIEAYDPATNSWSTLPSMPMPRHGVAGAVIGNRFHLVSGMIQSAGAMTFLDPTLSAHTAMHDILELQFGAPPPAAADGTAPAPSQAR